MNRKFYQGLLSLYLSLTDSSTRHSSLFAEEESALLTEADCACCCADAAADADDDDDDVAAAVGAGADGARRPWEDGAAVATGLAGGAFCDSCGFGFFSGRTAGTDRRTSATDFCERRSGDDARTCLAGCIGAGRLSSLLPPSSSSLSYVGDDEPSGESSSRTLSTMLTKARALPLPVSLTGDGVRRSEAPGASE